MNLEVGDRVTFKSTKNKQISTIIVDCIGFRDDLLDEDYCEILKIERPHYEVIEEKKELLTEEEKELLKLYIKYIKSLKNGKIETIYRQNNWMTLRLKTELEYTLDIGPKYSNMENCREYTLKELGLESD